MLEPVEDDCQLPRVESLVEERGPAQRRVGGTVEVFSLGTVGSPELRQDSREQRRLSQQMETHEGLR